MERQVIGEVTHYFGKIGVAIIRLDSPLKVGERIAIVGSTTDLEQDVKSMQVEHHTIDIAKAGDLVGLKVKDKVREGDTVFGFLPTGS
jgi:translation elongation factor EF-1alpha